MAHHHSRGGNDVEELAPMVVALIATLIGLFMRSIAVRYLRNRQTPLVNDVDYTRLNQSLQQEEQLQQQQQQQHQHDEQLQQQPSDMMAPFTLPQSTFSSSVSSSMSTSSSPPSNIPSDNNNNMSSSSSSSPSISSISQSSPTSSSSSSLSNDVPPVVAPGSIVFRLLVSNTGIGGDAVSRWITLARERSSYTVGALINEAFGNELANGSRVTCLYQGLRLREEMTLDQYSGMTSGATIHAIVQPPPGTTNTNNTNNNNSINNNMNNGNMPHVIHPRIIINRSSITVSTSLIMVLCLLTSLLGALSGFAFVIHVNWDRPRMALAWLTSLIAAVVVFAITATNGQRLVQPVGSVGVPIAAAGGGVAAIHIGANGMGIPVAFRLPGLVQQHHQHQQ
jgi:hypothetical protein